MVRHAAGACGTEHPPFQEMFLPDVLSESGSGGSKAVQLELMKRGTLISPRTVEAGSPDSGESRAFVRGSGILPNSSGRGSGHWREALRPCGHWGGQQDGVTDRVALRRAGTHVHSACGQRGCRAAPRPESAGSKALPPVKQAMGGRRSENKQTNCVTPKRRRRSTRAS